jgi:NAD(P)-dependent dehydrogenase (short-subunit alcohol dehydrogenase family)
MGVAISHCAPMSSQAATSAQRLDPLVIQPVQMAKTILVAGYGPGVSAAVAEKFGAQGFQVALVGRSADKLATGVKALEGKGVKAAAFPADLGDPAAIRAMVENVHAGLGPISVIEWTAYSPGNLAGDLLTASPADVRSLFDISVVGLVALVQAALPDLRSEKGAILVTNGGAGFIDTAADAVVVQYGMMGLGVANAAKHKLVGVLAKKLETDGIYVAEIMISGSIKGTPFDRGQPGAIEGKIVAEKYWELYQARKDVRTTLKGG